MLDLRNIRSIDPSMDLNYELTLNKLENHDISIYKCKIEDFKLPKNKNTTMKSFTFNHSEIT